MSRAGRVVSFAAGLYGMRAALAWYGYARRDPMSLLALRPGRVDPYRIHRGLRRGGPMVPTRLGDWVTTSHRICHQVLRDRRFGVQPADTPAERQADAFDMSFLEMNAPDHTRLRRLAQPAFGPRRVAGYRPRVESTVDGLLDGATAAGRFDLIGELAAPLPIAVITALRVLAERVPHLRRAGRPRRRNSTTIRGPIHLPVRTTAA
jgi:cytochrome P450